MNQGNGREDARSGESAGREGTRFRAHHEAIEASMRAKTRSRRAVLWGFSAVVLLAGGVGATVLGVRALTARPEPRVTVPVAVGFTGRVDHIAPTPTEGVFVRLPATPSERPIGLLAPIAPGARVRTDERTSARLAFDDGTLVVLARDSEVEILAHEARTIRLLRGSAQADVAHLEHGPSARFLGAHGSVEVLGTRFRMTETDDRTVVEVERGRVRLASRLETKEVGEGEEGIATEGGEVRVAARSDGSESSWLDDGDEEETVSGLGELIARRPGERQSRERPLALAEHRVSVKIAGTVARTEVEETFRNDDDATLEGVYRFPLPSGARIASLELEVDGRFVAGAFVDRERGQRIFRGVIEHATPRPERRPREEIIWVPGPWRDPALLEQQRGGRFELRIFPIPAHGERRVRIAYEQDVPKVGELRRYVYPLPSVRRGDARVGRFGVDVEVTGATEGSGVRVGGYAMRTDRSQGRERLSYQASSFAPNGDFVLEYALAGGETALRYAQYRGDAVPASARDPRRSDANPAELALEADERGYALFTLTPDLPVGAEHRATDFAIVVDSSQSMRGERFRRASRIAERLVAGLDRRHRVLVVACDLDCRAAPSGLGVPSGELARDAADFLSGITPAGSSDLVASVSRALRSVPRAASRARAVVYVGDGVASAGALGSGTIAREVEAIARREGVMVHTLGIAGDADGASLAAIARAAGGHYVAYAAGESASRAADAMLAATSGPSLVMPTVELPAGLEDVAPARLPTLRPGVEVKISARVRGAVRGELVLRGKLAGRDYERRYPIALPDDGSDRNAFVPRAWASARIADLETEAASRRDELAALSVRYGVVSSATSLIVLESEAMFRAYGFDRSSGPLQWSGDEGVDETAVGELSEAPAEPSLDRAAAPMRAGSSGAGGLAMASAEAAPAPAPSSAARSRADEMEMARPVPPPRGPGRYMRRVAYREATIGTSRMPSTRDLRALDEARAALELEPDHRDRMLALVRAAFRAGREDEVEKALSAWLERDPADVDAIALASDVAHQQGRTREALRLLSGLSDLAPNDASLQKRLVEAFERGGDEENACAHRVALAEASGEGNEKAMLCARSLGLEATAEALASRAAGLAERIASDSRSPTDVRGELVLDARFQGGDVDLVLVTPRGERISFLGGRRDVSARDVRSTTTESLGLRAARVGSYRIEVVRADGSRGPIRGTVRVRALGTVRELPFDLFEENAVVGRVEVAQRFRMVPL